MDAMQMVVNGVASKGGPPVDGFVLEMEGIRNPDL
jgi:hypothetical protein